MPAVSRFNVAKGRCENCQGEGFVMVELLFLPSVYAPCPVCHGARYNAKTLEINYRDKNIAEVLGMTVDDAWEFFAEEPLGAPRPHRAARSGPGLSAPGPARHRAIGRRGPAHQAGYRAAAHPARQLPLHPRRAHHRPAPLRRRKAHGPARRPGRSRQHGHCSRARHARSSRLRLGDRHWPRCGRRRRPGSSSRARLRK